MSCAYLFNIGRSVILENTMNKSKLYWKPAHLSIERFGFLTVFLSLIVHIRTISVTRMTVENRGADSQVHLIWEPALFHLISSHGKTKVPDQSTDFRYVKTLNRSESELLASHWTLCQHVLYFMNRVMVETSRPVRYIPGITDPKVSLFR